MKRFGWMWVVLMVAMLVVPATTLLAQEDMGDEQPEARKVKKEKKARADKPRREKKTKQPKVRKTEWEAKWLPMATALKMDEQQVAQLKEKVEARDATMAEWNKGDGAKLAELKKQYSAARKDGKDKEELAEIRKQIKPLQDEQKKLQTEKTGEIMAVLTDDQKVTWAGIQESDKALKRFSKLNLDDDQKARIRQICQAAAKEQAQAKDRKQAGSIRKKMGQDILAVLTDEQREAMSKKPEKKARDNADRPKREKKEKREKSAKREKKVDTEDRNDSDESTDEDYGAGEDAEDSDL